MKLLDDLVVQLEELHLAGRSRVPKDMQPALDRINAALPEDLRERWRTGISIVTLPIRPSTCRTGFSSAWVSRPTTTRRRTIAVRSSPIAACVPVPWGRASASSR